MLLENNTQRARDTEGQHTQARARIKTIYRLRTRMGLSFVIVTLLIVLSIEALFSAAIYTTLTQTHILGYVAMTKADQAARIYALEAELDGEGAALNPGITFEPGQPSSLTLRDNDDQPDLSFFHLTVPYIHPGTTPEELPTFALLIDTRGKVVASSYPDRFPIAQDVSALPPDEIELIRGALAGKSDGNLIESPQGRLASIARTVFNKDEQPIGAVYIQTPGEVLYNISLTESVSRVLLPTGLAWLCLMLPVGLLFGILTTRGLIRRIEHLAGATQRYAEGDYSQRVPVHRPDEVGQLEEQFNRMAGQLVNSFAERQAQAEESVRREERARIEQEMASAHYIQQSLLPMEVPSIPGWTIAPHYQPARQVGGDLYDFLPLSDGRIGIVIGDATGKGMPAALIMATTCAMLRAAAPGSDSPGRALQLVNDLLQVHIPRATFVTCFYAVLDPSSGHLTYANAGHNLPYLAGDGQVVELRAVGLPLGLMPDQVYPEGDIIITPGNRILFHTDGLVEAHDAEGEMFGSHRLQHVVQAQAPDGEMIPSVLDALHGFTGPDWEQEDDITLILLRRVE